MLIVVVIMIIVLGRMEKVNQMITDEAPAQHVSNVNNVEKQCHCYEQAQRIFFSGENNFWHLCGFSIVQLFLVLSCTSQDLYNYFYIIHTATNIFIYPVGKIGGLGLR